MKVGMGSLLGSVAVASMCFPRKSLNNCVPWTALLDLLGVPIPAGDEERFSRPNTALLAGLDKSYVARQGKPLLVLKTGLYRRCNNRLVVMHLGKSLLKRNAEAATWNWRVMQRDPTVFVRGAVSHPDHAIGLRCQSEKQ